MTDSTTTPEQTAALEHAHSRVRRTTLFERIVAVLAGIVVAGALIVATIGVVRQNELSEQNDQLQCFVAKQAEFMAAVGEAFNAPPAPNEQRARITRRIGRTARELKQLDEHC